MKRLFSFLPAPRQSPSLKAAGIIVTLNLILTAVALLRDISLASYLGTSSTADALLLAYFIPDTIGALSLGTALNMACVPILSKLLVAKEQGRYHRFIVIAWGGILLFTAFLTLGLNYFAGPIITALGTGFSQDTAQLAVKLFRTMLPLVIIYPLVMAGSAVLQAKERFTVPALGPVVFNLVFLTGVASCAIRQIPLTKGAHYIAQAITAGSAAMVAVLAGGSGLCPLATAWRNSIVWFTPFSLTSSDKKDLQGFAQLFFPYLLILMTNQSVLFIERYLASRLEAGTIAGLNYAYRISQFPIWVFIAALGVVILPAISKSQGLGRTDDFQSLTRRSLLTTLAFSLPLALTINILRTPIISILLQRGAFDSSSLAITADILAGYSWAAVGQALVYIFVRIFLARGKMVLPLCAGLLSAFINAGADYLFVLRLGSAGIGYGAFLGSLINAGLLYLLLKKELGISLREHSHQAARIIAANLPLVFTSLLLLKLWRHAVLGTALLLSALYVFVVICVSAVVYFFSLRLAKVI